ncbi:NUDIX hydrolase domain-like protein [Hypoxylon rubiginosum]|uniref:NUDIX hydrolase domain-like protein n=1 Tax=Hypoxylon rubiginosum TaxID=110542 RepID=A0ACB9YZY3_9PEZI|nr:NUDIX hydrolase domain-like protein [Hypoxylon rubiginosum]
MSRSLHARSHVSFRPQAASESIGKKFGLLPPLEFLTRERGSHQSLEQNRARRYSYVPQQKNNCKPDNIGNRVGEANISASSVSAIHQILRKFRGPSANMPRLSNLGIMKEADAFPYPDKELEAYDALNDTLYTLVWKDGQPLGYMLDSVVKQLLATPEEVRGPVVVDEAKRTVRAFELPTEAERTTRVAALMAYWRENQTFDILGGWRDELWPVYGSDTEVLYSAERSGTGLLGIMRYGVHMTGYVRDDTAPHGMKILVAQRAANKSTYPGMLDNSVAGGLMTGEDPFECIIREADEEADVPEALMRERARFTGMVTYIYITDERAGGEAGQIYPETQWVYDIELPADFEPTPKDGEVAGFYMWTVDEVKEKLAEGRFKPNCALILVDFFLRHKILTPENEPDYDEIVRRLHRKLPFPGPHQAGSSTV